MSGSLRRLEWPNLRSMAHVSHFECNFCSLRFILTYLLDNIFIRFGIKLYVVFCCIVVLRPR